MTENQNLTVVGSATVSGLLHESQCVNVVQQFNGRWAETRRRMAVMRLAPMGPGTSRCCPNWRNVDGRAPCHCIRQPRALGVVSGGTGTFSGTLQPENHLVVNGSTVISSFTGIHWIDSQLQRRLTLSGLTAGSGRRSISSWLSSLRWRMLFILLRLVLQRSLPFFPIQGIQVLSSSGASALRLWTNEAISTNRNWNLQNRYSALGQLELRVSTAAGGTCSPCPVAGDPDSGKPCRILGCSQANMTENKNLTDWKPQLPRIASRCRVIQSLGSFVRRANSWSFGVGYKGRIFCQPGLHPCF